MKTLLVTLSIFALSFGAQNAAVTKNASFNIEKVNANELYISLEADSDVYGLQFDLNYNADEITLTESDISHMFDGSDARSNMSVYSKIKEPGMARVIMFDLGGEAILNANNLEQVIRLSYSPENVSNKTTVTVNNIVAAGLHGEEVTIDDSVEATFDVSDANMNPFETQIVGNYPNPFNPVTQISFNLASAGQVDVVVFDLQGRKVATIYSGLLDAKEGHTFNWDASNVSSGKYFARITAPGFSGTHNMTLIK
tara:strand:- start:526 stop:1287 length:762 start_codon:yes stop_codon:yes gene_type:complete